MFTQIIKEIINTIYKSIEEIFRLLVEVRVDLTDLMEPVKEKEVKEELYWAINEIDIVGCELTQNITKKLNEKSRKTLGGVQPPPSFFAITGIGRDW
ncbi:MAG: hypothetical protein P8X49_10925 [Syntrophobacterales bacterium]